MENELYHYGVKGMKWGVRQAEEASRSLDRKKREYRLAKRLRNGSVYLAYRQKNDESWNDVARRTQKYNATKAEYKRAKMEFKEYAPNSVKVKRGAKKAAVALAAIGAAYVVDQKYFGGLGAASTKVAAEAALKVVGMTAITALDVAGRSSNIRWKV